MRPNINLGIVQRLAVPRKLTIFGHKRCQKKRKDVNYKLLQEFFQKSLVVHEQSAVKNSVSTYIRMLYPGRFILVETVCHSHLNISKIPFSDLSFDQFLKYFHILRNNFKFLLQFFCCLKIVSDFTDTISIEVLGPNFS